MFKIKENPFYKKYFIFGKCVWKQKKPIKQIAKYVLSVAAEQNVATRQYIDDTSDKLRSMITELQDELAMFYERTREIKISDNKLCCDGLWAIEDWGGWIKGSANLYLTFSKNTTTDIELHIKVSKLSSGHTKQELVVFVNDKYNTTFATDKDVDDLCIVIPYKDLVDCKFKTIVSLFATNQLSPKELGISDDARKLSYGLLSVSSSVDIITYAMDSHNHYKVCNHKTTFCQEEWEKYIKYDLDENKIQGLCNNLGSDSIDVIKDLLYRRRNEYRFSTEELYKKHLASINDISKYKIVNTHGFQPEVFYFKNGLKFLDEKIIKKHLSNGAVIDGGACSGDSALMFAEYDFVKKVYAFEPCNDIYSGMAETLKVNKCTKAEAIHAGLSDIDGFADIMGEKCKTITIDTFAKDKTISCIKLDIEGMEYSVISGALETIKRDKPLLLICVYHKPKDFFEIKPLIESLNLGYKFKIVDTEPCNDAIGVHAVLIGYIE